VTSAIAPQVRARRFRGAAPGTRRVESWLSHTAAIANATLAAATSPTSNHALPTRQGDDTAPDRRRAAPYTRAPRIRIEGTPHLMTAAPGPTRLITPGTVTALRTSPSSDGLIDVRALPTKPFGTDRSRILITAVGAAWCSELDGIEIDDAATCAPGSLILTHGVGAAPGASGAAAAVLQLVEPDGQLHVAGIWLHLTDGWIEFLRPTISLTARLIARTAAPATTVVSELRHGAAL
jgi:hypothetical protein